MPPSLPRSPLTPTLPPPPSNHLNWPQPPNRHAGSGFFDFLAYASFASLWVATGFAVWSLVIYFSNVWTHFIYPPPKPHSH